MSEPIIIRCKYCDGVRSVTVDTQAASILKSDWCVDSVGHDEILKLREELKRLKSGMIENYQCPQVETNVLDLKKEIKELNEDLNSAKVACVHNMEEAHRSWDEIRILREEVEKLKKHIHDTGHSSKCFMVMYNDMCSCGYNDFERDNNG